MTKPPRDPAVKTMTTEELQAKADELRKLNPTTHDNEVRRHTYQAEIYRRSRSARSPKR